MAAETDFIKRLRRIATHSAARGLADDAAVLEPGAGRLVLTHDAIVEGVHFLPSDPPADVAWKLVAVNLSDLAAKGARPVGALMGYSLARDTEWDAAFAAGLEIALAKFELALLGGDTVSLPLGSPRVLSLTAIGEAPRTVPSRSGAVPGDDLWVSGTIGDAGAGLRILRGELEGPAALAERYRRPQPRLEAGQRLAPLVSAMMDVSDGLLIDAQRLAEASAVALRLQVQSVPLSTEFRRALGEARDARLSAAVAGDDYELLFTAPPGRMKEIADLAVELRLPLARIGAAAAGTGLRMFDGEAEIPLPAALGWEHR